MPRERNRCAAALVVALASALAAPGVASAQGGSCADCCKLPCIEARIWEATYMKGFYQRLAATPGITQERYEARENDAKLVSASMSGIYLGANPACAWETPDPRNPTSWRERFKGTGFSIQEEGGVENWSFTLKVDPETCSLTHPRGAEVLPSVTPCEGIGRATVAHEQRHVEDCCKRKGGKLAASEVPGVSMCRIETPRQVRPLKPSENAAHEVEGYKRELEELDKVRREAAQDCTKKSCKTSGWKWEIAARHFRTDIKKLLGLGGQKPPSKSPLARGRRGG